MVPNIKKRSYTLLSLNSYETLREKTETLNKNLELCRRYKQETINYVKRITEQYKKGILKYAEYEYILNRHLKGQTLEYWTQHYDVQEKKIKEKIRELRTQKLSPLETQITRIEKKPEKNFFIYFLGILILSLGIASISYYDISLGNIITGMVTEDQVTSFITSYSPGTNPEILTGETQTFTITTSAPENTTLSIQWYVNNLPIADQDSETFDYMPNEPGEYEIKVLVNDLKDYTTQKWTLKVNSSGAITPEENVTAPEDDLVLPEMYPDNQTEENITLPENASLENIIGPVAPEPADKLIQLAAEINKPVRWVRIVKNENLEQILKVYLPKDATNIEAKKIIPLITGEVKENIPPEKIIIDGTRLAPKYSITGAATIASSGKSKVLEFLKKLFRITSLAITDYPTQTKELVVEETAAKYEISYETPPPLVEETLIENGKRIRVYSDYAYENILTYTEIKETKGEINLYWLTNNTRIPYEAELIDTNNNNLTDKVQWVTHHLSEQTFEIVTTEIVNETVQNQTNFTILIPSKEVYEVLNCPLCPALKNATDQLCLQINAIEGGSDYGAEIAFETPDNTSVSYADVCMYQFTISQIGPRPEDISLTNYVSPVEQIGLEISSVESIPASWSSISISEKNGWVCGDVTNILNTAILEGKKQFSVRWWGPDLKNKASLPYVCFRGPKTTLDQCDNDNPSGANDCRPYMRVIEK